MSALHNQYFSPPGPVESALVVDLDSRSLYEICKDLREIGYRTFGATSFIEAKRFLIAEHPRLLIADVRLGEFNGIQLLLLAKELRPGISVVITTAFPDPVLAAETQRMGGTFMIKPIEARELIDTLKVRWTVSTATERRQSDRRVLRIPNYSPDRRLGDRRRA